MSRHGTNTNPVHTLRRQASHVAVMTGSMPNIMKISRRVRLPRAARAMLRKFGISIQIVALAVLCLGVGPCEENVREEPRQFSRSDCETLKLNSEKQVAACQEMCPEHVVACVADSCLTGAIAAWIEARPNCQMIPRFYHPNPSWPKVSLIVE